MELSTKLSVRPLLEENRGFLKAIHNATGVDFEGDVVVAPVQLPKTIKAIVKDFGILKGKTSNYIVIQNRHDGEYRILEFFAGGTFTVDLQTEWNRNCRLDHYYRKSDFDKDRKNGNLKCFVVIAPKRDNSMPYFKLKNIEEKNTFTGEEDKTTRYVIDSKDVKKASIYKDGQYIPLTTGAYNISALTSNRKETFSEDYSYARSGLLTDDIHDIIDKSGYNVFKIRCSLHSKADKIRYNKKLEEVANADFTEENKSIEDRIAQAYIKNLSALKSQNILTKDVETIDKLLDISYAIKSISKAYQKHLEQLKLSHEDNSAWGAYKSTDGVKNCLNRLNERLDEIEDRYLNLPCT